MDSFLFIAAIYIVLYFIDIGSGLQCHQYNSYDSFYYGDPLDHPDDQEIPITLEFLKECEDPDAEFCRTIRQSVRDETRVIRTCGKDEDIDPWPPRTKATSKRLLHNSTWRVQHWAMLLYLWWLQLEFVHYIRRTEHETLGLVDHWDGVGYYSPGKNMLLVLFFLVCMLHGRICDDMW